MILLFLAGGAGGGTGAVGGNGPLGIAEILAGGGSGGTGLTGTTTLIVGGGGGGGIDFLFCEKLFVEKRMTVKNRDE